MLRVVWVGSRILGYAKWDKVMHEQQVGFTKILKTPKGDTDALGR